MSARNAGLRAAILLLCLPFASACSRDGDDPISPSDVAGTWEGTSSQQQGVSFVVTESGVALSTFTYRMQCGFTGYATVSIPAESDPLPIVDGRFAIARTQISRTVFLSATGEFVSEGEARGTLTIETEGCERPLDVTWTANRQG